MPSSAHLRDALQPHFDHYGYEIEQIIITDGPRRATITIIVDGDHRLSLDHAAQLSHLASNYLDQCPIDDPYVLEISSPGVDRPLTTLKHFQRNCGRKIVLSCHNGCSYEGRILQATQDQLVMVIAQNKDFVLQKIPFPEIMQAIVQVEFSSPSAREMRFFTQQVSNPEMESGA